MWSYKEGEHTSIYNLKPRIGVHIGTEISNINL
uniref:Uncharacterized protein n=1 Tax=Arundo donax TaxID=35708 RepID=A0A0A8Y9J5_ARUDO